jgi:arylsulfatase A-like enzyme
MAKKILLVILDQFRADCVTGALAGDLDLPNLRSFAAQSVSFDQHYSVATPCGPARASLLTGLYAMNHRSVRNGAPLDQNHTHIGLEARKAGLEPLLFGYTDTSVDPRYHAENDPDLRNYEGIAPGFNKIVSMRLATNYTWRADLAAKGYDVPGDPAAIFRPVPSDGDAPAIKDPAVYRAEDSDTAFLTDETLKALKVRSHQDWLSFVAYIRPHPPLVAPAPYNQMYDPQSIRRPIINGPFADYERSHPFFGAFAQKSDSRDLYWGFDGHMAGVSAADSLALRAVYFGLATEVDHHIGRLLSYLDDSGQADDTLVIFTADHGEMLGDHYMWGKQTYYDASYKVPLIIRDPRNKQSAGSQVTHMTESVDIAPTINDWLGQEMPLAYNGRSLLPLIGGNVPADWRRHIFCEIELGNLLKPSRFQTAFDLPPEHCQLAVVREASMKYVHFNGGIAPMLFDLDADPDETTNVAGTAEYAGEELRLARKMIDHRMGHAHHALSQIQISAHGAIAVPRHRS